MHKTVHAIQLSAVNWSEGLGCCDAVCINRTKEMNKALWLLLIRSHAQREKSQMAFCMFYRHSLCQPALGIPRDQPERERERHPEREREREISLAGMIQNNPPFITNSEQDLWVSGLFHSVVDGVEAIRDRGHRKKHATDIKWKAAVLPILWK